MLKGILVSLRCARGRAAVHPASTVLHGRRLAQAPQAQIECAGIISSIEAGTYLEPDKTTLAVFIQHWLSDVKSRVSPRTVESYTQVARANIIPMLGGTILRDLRPQAISAAYSKALTEGRKSAPGGLSARTVHHMHTVLKSALQQAVRWEMLPRNPADAVRAPKVERGQMTTYDLSQTAQLMEAFRETRMFIPVLLAVLCGLRDCATGEKLVILADGRLG